MSTLKKKPRRMTEWEEKLITVMIAVNAFTMGLIAVSLMLLWMVEHAQV
jgi:hypothetical protein